MKPNRPGIGLNLSSLSPLRGAALLAASVPRFPTEELMASRGCGHTNDRTPLIKIHADFSTPKIRPEPTENKAEQSLFLRAVEINTKWLPYLL